MVCLRRFKDAFRLGLTLALLMLCLFQASESGAKRVESALEITGLRLSGSSLILQSNRPFTGEDTQNFSILKLPNPARVLVEIPNASLRGVPKNVVLNQAGIQQVEFSETHSSFYNAVRVLVHVNDSAVLSRSRVAFENDTLVLETAPIQSASVLPGRPPLPPAPVSHNPPIPQAAAVGAQDIRPIVPMGAHVIEAVSLQGNRLTVKANANAELRIKNRFTLTGPSRLVLDIDNAMLKDRSLAGVVPGTSSELQQVRLGQFDEKTVRVVIQAPSPEAFEVIYPGDDHSLISITPHAGTSMTKLASGTRLGHIESIALHREGGSTVVRLTSNTPIVHRFLKRDDRIHLDLLNVAAFASGVGFDARLYPEIRKMRFDALTADQPNSKFMLDLASAEVRVVPTLSDDGKTLELQLTNAAPSLGDVLVSNIGSDLGVAGKAPFPARIVVDAGHGGKDLGANRDGVNEKDLNLSLALMVKDALEAKGFQVYMTRDTDVFLPLPSITAITNRIRPDLFISIHHNASVNPAAHGIETYYYTPQSRPLADRIQRREINTVAAQDGGVKRAMFYVIHHTNVPAVLCEVGYVSNSTERAELQSADRKQKTARAIADGVVDYLKTRMSARAK